MLGNERPECVRVVPMGEVAHLVEDHVLQNRLGRFDKVPVELKDAALGQTAPERIRMDDLGPLGALATPRPAARLTMTFRLLLYGR